MARLNLEAKNQPQALILAYLEQNASESLVERINQGKHSLQECFDYIRNEARKQAVNNVAAIEDSQVYGWAIHYFEENGNPGDVPTDDAPKAYDVTGPKPVRIVREAKKEDQQPKMAERVIVPNKPRIPDTTKPKPKKTEAEQIPGQTSIFDFL